VNAWADLAKPRVRIPSEGTAQASSSVAQEIGLGNEVQQDSHRSHTDDPSAIDRSERSEVRIPSEGTTQASSSVAQEIDLGNEVQQDSHRSHTDDPSALDRSERSEVRIPAEGTAQASSSVAQEIGLGNEVQQDSHRSHTDAPSAIDRSERSEVRIPSEGTAQASSSVAQEIGLGNEVQQESHRSHTDAPSAIDRSERNEVRIPSEGTAQASSSVAQEIVLGNEVQQDSHRSHTYAHSAIDRSERSETSCKPYYGCPRESSSPGDRNAVSHSFGRKKQFPSPERLNTGTPSGMSYLIILVAVTHLPQRSLFFILLLCVYLTVQSQGISRAAAHRPSRHNDYSYERNTKQPSNYYESHICSKRPHSAVVIILSTNFIHMRLLYPFVTLLSLSLFLSGGSLPSQY